MTPCLVENVFPHANEIEIGATADDIERFVCQRVMDGLLDHGGISQSDRQENLLQDALFSTIIDRAGKTST